MLRFDTIPVTLTWSVSGEGATDAAPSAPGAVLLGVDSA
jgi:hypothetical protein